MTYDPQDDFSRRLEEQLRRVDEQRRERQEAEEGAAAEREPKRRYAHPAQAFRGRLDDDGLPFLRME